ncbi:hypothetical protein [Glycomyces salinus]|uniref:hypothetical protein n=1 Tax=Glycomyces salinus TaxID=980294 RepID=UPI0018EDA6A7|nr:hypothetical protein [Glycomyces salinus]
MFAKLVKRAVIVVAAMAALVIATSGQAQAASTSLHLYDLDHTRLGYMVQQDEGIYDRITVCDTYNDKYIMVGKVYDGTDVIASVSDGSGGGCSYTITRLYGGSQHDYWMSLCWNGPTTKCTTRNLSA